MALLFLVVKYAVLIFFPWSLFITFYRLKLHPLKRFPGPSIAKLSDWYGGYLAATRRAHLVIWQDHEKYGPVMRYGPDRLLFNSATAVEDIYRNPRLSKSRVYLGSRSNSSSTVFNELDTDMHRRKRRIISQPLTDRSLRNFEPTILEQINIFVEQLRYSTFGGNVVNMTERCERLGIDIIGYLGFGFPLQLQTDEIYRYLPAALAARKTRINILMHQPALRIFYSAIKLLAKRQRERILNVLGLMISSRTALKADAKADFYSFAAGHLDLGSGDAENSELWAEAAFFITAGGTPPATAMSALLFYLSRNGRAYARLAQEIRSTFRSDEDIRGGPQLASCQYLRACIHESLRLSPPSLATLWREQIDDKTSPLVIDGHVVPKGTHVGISIYSLHHNEKYFPDSFAFKPERWLAPSHPEGPEQQEARSRMNKAFIPFLVGPRSCAGKALTYLEVSLVIAKIMWYFDFEPVPGELGKLGGRPAGRADGTERSEEYLLYDIFNSAHEGPNLIFKSRQSPMEDWILYVSENAASTRKANFRSSA